MYRGVVRFVMPINVRCQTALPSVPRPTMLSRELGWPVLGREAVPVVWPTAHPVLTGAGRGGSATQRCDAEKPIFAFASAESILANAGRLKGGVSDTDGGA